MSNETTEYMINNLVDAVKYLSDIAKQLAKKVEELESRVNEQPGKRL